VHLDVRPDAASCAAPRPAPADPTAAKAASAWVQQFARTLKTCRLYDGDNPTVVRLREDLAATLPRSLAEVGDLTLTFTPTDVLCEEESLYPARSRDDNLALPFYRDGVRALTLRQGIEPGEVENLVDLVLRVTGPHASDEDLVTLLWDSGLPHVEISYVATDGDVDGGGDAEPAGGESLAIAPWPETTGTAGGAPAAGGPEGDGPDREAEAQAERSDDRLTGTDAGDLAAGFDELDARAPEELARFRNDYRSDCEATLVHTGIGLMRDCLAAGGAAADRAEFAPFLLRVVREAIGAGLWTEALEGLELLRGAAAEPGQLAAVLAELCHSDLRTTRDAVRAVDGQDAAAVERFLALARSLGPAAAEWLMHVLAESQKQRVRRPLTQVIAELCRDHPERLVPWLSDPRWYVVRNTVHILGWIGGPRIAGLLHSARDHEEYRVRREVVAALAQAGTDAARPVLIAMLDGTDSRIFCAVLHQLAGERDPDLAHRLAGQIQDPHFDERPAEEQRAVYFTLAAVGDDSAVPALEAELTKGSRFARGLEAHRQAVARCLARLGTAAARQALADGLRSKNPAVRKACEEVAGGGGA
jgi:hypothetical protein